MAMKPRSLDVPSRVPTAPHPSPVTSRAVRRPAGIARALLAAALAAGAPALAAGEKVIATVGGVNITEAYVQQATALQDKGKSLPGKPEQMLPHLVQTKVVATYARQRWGAEAEAEIARKIERDEAPLLADLYRAEHVIGKAARVSDEELGDAKGKEREERRKKLQASRIDDRQGVVLVELGKRFSFSEDAQAVEEVVGGKLPLAKVPPDRVLARYAGRKITVADLQEAVRLKFGGTPPEAHAAKVLPDVYLFLVEVGLFSQAAREEGLDRSPAVVARREPLADLFWADYLAQRVRREAAAVGEKELRAYYDSHRSDHPGEFGAERAAVERKAVAERTGQITSALMNEAREKVPVVYPSGR